MSVLEEVVGALANVAGSYINRQIEKNTIIDELFSQAYSLGELEKYDEALFYYEKVIQIDGNNSDAWNKRGSILFKMGREQDAIRSLEKSIELNPDNQNAKLLRDQIMERLRLLKRLQECEEEQKERERKLQKLTDMMEKAKKNMNELMNMRSGQKSNLS